MTNNSHQITEVLAQSTTEFEKQGYSREVAFDAAVAVMISVAPEAMRQFLANARKQFEAATN